MSKTPLLAWEERALLLACSTCIFLCILPHTMSIPIMPSIIKNLNTPTTNVTGNGSAQITQEKLIEFLFIGNLVGTPFTGWISDCWGSRLYPLLISLTLMTIGNLITAFGERHRFLYLCARFVIGISIGSIWVLIMAIMADIFPTKNEDTQIINSKIPLPSPMLGSCSPSHSGSSTMDELTTDFINIKRNVNPIYFGFAMGIVSAFYGLGAAIGPKFSVLLTNHISQRSPSLFCAFLSFVLIFWFLVVNPDKLVKRLFRYNNNNSSSSGAAAAGANSDVESINDKKDLDNDEPVKESRVRLRDILRNPQIIGALGLTVLAGCNSGTVQSKISNWLSKQDPVSFDADGLANWLFWVIIPNIVVTVLLGDFIDRDIIPLGIISLLGILFNSIFMSLMAEIDYIYLFSILFGVSIPLVTSPIIPILSISIKKMIDRSGGTTGTSSDKGAFGLIFSLYNTASNIGIIVGPMLLPTIVDKSTSIKGGLYLLSAISIAYIPVYLFIVKGKFVSAE